MTTLGQPMLQADLIRIGSSSILAAYVVGALLLSRGLSSGAPRSNSSVKVHIPGVLETLWPLSNVLIPVIFLLISIAYPQAVYGSFLNISFPGDTYLQAVGFGLFFVGGLLSFASARHLGRFMMVEIAVTEDHELIRTGPYSMIRHPTYTALLLMSLALALFLLHLALFLNFLAVLAIANYRAGLEEGLLASERGFGQEYRKYMERTGRFFPRLRRQNRTKSPS